MATQSVPLFNTDPNIQAQAALIQQRQLLAQKLMEEGLKPVDTAGRTVGGVAYHVSPFEGLAKAMQMYGGQKMLQGSTSDLAGLASQAYANALQANQPGSAPSYSDGQMSQAMDNAVPQVPGGGPPAPAEIAKALQSMAPQNGGANPRNPLGMPAELLTGFQAGFIPKEAFEAQAGLFKPTDATLQARQAGVDPMAANRGALAKANTDPKILAMQQAGFSPDQIYRAVYGEQAKAGDIERRPDQMFSNTLTGERGFVPKIPEGSNPVGVPGVNGAVPGVVPIPGAQPIMQGNSQAGATGAASGGIRDVTLPSGAVVPLRGSQAAPVDADRTAIYQSEMNAAQQRLANAKTPEDQARAQGDIQGLQRETQRLGIKLGQSTADKVTQEAGAKVMADLPMQLQQSKQTVTGLENAYRTIEAIGKSGPGISKSVNALALVNNLGIPLMKDDTNGYQTLKKFLENSASTAAASNGFTGSDARFEQFKSGQPNAETMNPDALKGAIRYVLSQHDANIARAQFIQQQVQSNQGDPNAAMKAQQQWSQAYNPRVFEFSRMTPPERAQAKASMNQDQRAKFGQQYNFAHQQGWVQ